MTFEHLRAVVLRRARRMLRTLTLTLTLFPFSQCSLNYTAPRSV